MAIPDSSKVPRLENDDEIVKFYADMTDAVLAKHIKTLMVEVSKRHAQRARGPLAQLALPAPPASTHVTDDLDTCSMREPKREYLDEEYLVLHEKASGVEYRPQFSNYTWNPRLMDFDGIRRTNELNNYHRQLFHLLDDDHSGNTPVPTPVEKAPIATKPRHRSTRPVGRPAGQRASLISRPSAKYWSKKGGDPVVECMCSLCNERFNTIRALLDHRSDEHSHQDMLKCGICWKSFQKRTHIYLHLSIEYKVNHCNGCDSTFVSKWHLERHKCDTIRENTPIQAKVTRKRTMSVDTEIKEELEDPDYGDTTPKTSTHYPTVMKCENCGKRYTQAHWMEKHKEKCTEKITVDEEREKSPPGKVDLNCDICLRHYSSIYWFDRHKEKCTVAAPSPSVVLPEKPSFQCQHCDKPFPTETSMSYHTRYCQQTKPHLPEMPRFTMEVLQGNNSSGDDMAVGLIGEKSEDHESKEEEEEDMEPVDTSDEDDGEEEDEDDDSRISVKVQCSICGLQYAGVSNLLTHRKKIHGMTAMLTCGICHKQCKSLSSIRRHVNQEYSIYLCPSCGRNCQDRWALQAHACLKQFKNRNPQLSRMQNGTGVKCSSCNTSFATSTILYNHRMTCERQEQHLSRRKTIAVVPVNNSVSNNRLPSTSNSRSTSTPRMVHPYANRTRAQSVYVPGPTNIMLKCTECNQQCTHLSDLALHRHRFHGKNQYSCNFCHRSFLTFRTLSDHHMIEIQRWKCSNCEKVFPRKYQLLFHERYCPDAVRGEKKNE